MPADDSSLRHSWEDTLSGSTSGLHSVQPTLPPPKVGQTFGRFRIDSILGRGAFAVVFRAFDLEAQRGVALKVLTKPTARRWARFLREGEVVARFDHPHIIKLHAFGEHGGHAYHALELVEGKPLDELAPLPPTRAAAIARELARATQYAHERGILHRDIKPSNVLVRPVDHPCLIDFGVARDQEENARLTSTGELVGTLQYVAPEQMVDSKRVGPPCDVYGIGATLYTLLTGETLLPPDAGPLAVLSTRPPLPSVYALDVPPELDTICAKCVEIRPEDRYATAAELGEALDAFLDAGQRGKGPLAWIAAGAAAVLLLGGLAFAFAGGDPLDDPATTDTPTTLDVLPSTAGDPRTPKVRALIDEATIQARQRRSYQTPLLTLKKAKRAAGDHPVLRAEVDFERASYLMRRGRYLEAGEGLARIQAPADLAARATFLRGLCLREQGAEDEARTLWWNLWSDDQESASGLLSGALAAQAVGDRRSAMERLEKARLKAPRDPYCVYVLGLLLTRSEPTAALNMFSNALLLLPDEPLILSAYGRLRLKQESPPNHNAVRAIRLAVALTEPTPDPALLETAVLLHAREHVATDNRSRARFSEVLAQLDRVLEARPRSAKALLWRGAVKFRFRKAAGGGVGGDQAFLEDPKAEEDWRAAQAADPHGFLDLTSELPSDLREAIAVATGQ